MGATQHEDVLETPTEDAPESCNEYNGETSGDGERPLPSKHAYVGPTSANVGIGAATSPSGDDVGPTLFR